MPGEAILVEFLGLPGAGKSAVSRRLAQALLARSLTVDEPSRVLSHGIGPARRMLRKVLRVSIEVLGRPLAAAATARVVACSGQPSTVGAAHLWFNWLLVTSLARHARRSIGVHLLDEGPAQGAWSVALEGDAASARALLERLPTEARPDLLVVVDARPVVVAGRIRARTGSDSRLDQRLESEPDLLDRGIAALIGVRALLESLPERGGTTRVIVLDNDQASDLERGARELADRVEAIARGRGPAALDGDG
jgi:thymidylate kinase